MALKFSAALVLATALCAAAGGALRAQSLQRLTVESFVLSADTTRPRVDVPFHLIVALHVRERVGEIANLELPMLAQLELQGDEREMTTDSRGTQYRETITVVAHSAGAIVIAPATLQAVDARDGRPKQWFTNDLRLVAGVSPEQVISQGSAILLRVASVLGGLLALAIVAGALVLAIRLGRPKPATVIPAASVPVAPAAIERTTRQRVDDAIVVLRAEHSRAAAVRVRSVIWRTIGASDGETLGDVLRRPAANDPPLRDALISLERSAFTYDDDLGAAIDDTCAALERYAESLP